MKRIHAVVAGLVAGVSLAVAGVTYAQPYGGMEHGSGPGMGMGHGHGPMAGVDPAATIDMGHGHGPMAGVDPAATIDSHLGDLKAQLKITMAQEAAWQTFANAAKKQATGMQSMHTQMQQGTGTAPERMAERATAIQQRAAAMETMASALKDLYATLTPEQKTIADQHFDRMGPHAMRSGPRSS
jgi:Spy/CpxP family protein refolding chaperone